MCRRRRRRRDSQRLPHPHFPPPLQLHPPHHHRRRRRRCSRVRSQLKWWWRANEAEAAPSCHRGVLRGGRQHRFHQRGVRAAHQHPAAPLRLWQRHRPTSPTSATPSKRKASPVADASGGSKRHTGSGQGPRGDGEEDVACSAHAFECMVSQYTAVHTRTRFHHPHTHRPVSSESSSLPALALAHGRSSSPRSSPSSPSSSPSPTSCCTSRTSLTPSPPSLLSRSPATPSPGRPPSSSGSPLRRGLHPPPHPAVARPLRRVAEPRY